MIKTRKSIAKKFKVTGTGKVLRRTAGKRHFLRNKTVKQKRRGMSQGPVLLGRGHPFRQNRLPEPLLKR